MAKKKIYYKSGFKYQLDRHYVHQLKLNPNVVIDTKYISIDKNGLLIILEGYAWDGASGPTYDSKNSMRASLVHDALYQLMRMGLLVSGYRDEADNEFYDMCNHLNISYNNCRNGVLGATEFINHHHTVIPGPDGKVGWGGMCFPKDTKAFAKFMGDNHLIKHTIQGAVDSNNSRRHG